MKREQFDVAAPLIDRMDRLEKTIFKLQEILNKDEYAIISYDYIHGENKEENEGDIKEYVIKLNSGEIATEVFVQDILEYYINTLNLELNELRKTLEEI